MTVELTLVADAPETAVMVHAIAPAAVESHALGAYLEANGFEAKAGATITVPNADGGTQILLGLGPDADRTVDTFRVAGAALARATSKHEALAVVGLLEAAGELAPAAVAQAFSEGIGLGHYRYTALKSKPEASSLASVAVVGKGGKRIQTAFDLGAAVADAVCITRDLVNEPGGTLTPEAFASEAVTLGETYGFAVTVLDEVGIEAAGMGGLLGVNRGSTLPPRFLELTWTPAGKARGVVALVGKGVTFDSGGLSIKPSDGMLTMKGDMAGGGAVLGAFCGLTAVAPRVEVRGYIPLTDNMLGGDATRLGDVLRISNGKTVEVMNTDAEGRLILADGLVRASAGQPDAIVDLATLTGACMVALGVSHAGIFGNNQAWIDQVSEASAAVDELTWVLPMPKEWRTMLDSDVADMKNIGGRYGGASTAALFLQEFVGTDGTDIPWVHLDIAGPAFAETPGALTPKGGTGYAVRTLLALVKGFRKPR